MKEYERITQKQGDPKIVSKRVYYRLRELEDKIENGTVIELPCNVGDKVWLIYENQVEFAEIWRIYLTPTYNEFKWFIPYDEIQPKDTGSFKTNEIGKTVFLTKAEAEKKLEELKGATK
jgi:hypothetical protein